MKKIVLLMAILTSIVFFIFNKENTTMVIKGIEDNSIELYKNKTHNKEEKLRPVADQKEDIAQLIAPLSKAEVEQNWEYEYGCSIDSVCENTYLNAKSVDEALWMHKKGYLAYSTVSQLESIPAKDLGELANAGNLSAKKLMAIYSIRKQNFEFARGYAGSAIASEVNGETFSLRILGEAYLMNKQPMLATVELRMASLLGDTDATSQYERLVQSSAPGFIDNVNQLAFNYLSAKYKTPIQEWNSDPRPSENDGG